MDSKSKWMAVALCLIMGGALGNALDRVIHGHVIDFIDLYYDCYHWPAFNLADVAISVGAAVLIIQEIFFIKEDASHHEHAKHH
jgi:signal peptidase II